MSRVHAQQSEVTKMRCIMLSVSFELLGWRSMEVHVYQRVCPTSSVSSICSILETSLAVMPVVRSHDACSNCAFSACLHPELHPPNVTSFHAGNAGNAPLCADTVGAGAKDAKLVGHTRRSNLAEVVPHTTTGVSETPSLNIRERINGIRYTLLYWPGCIPVWLGWIWHIQ